MIGQHRPSYRSGRKKERRRFPRYSWIVPTGVKTADQRVFEGSLLNMGQGGGMLETKEALAVGDQLWLKFREEEGDPSGIVLWGRAVWAMPTCGGTGRYGVAFSEGQAQAYENLRRHAEVVHSKSVARDSGLDFVELRPSIVEKKALDYVDKDLAFSLNCVPIKLRGEKLMVALAEPKDSRSLDKLCLYSQCKVTPVVATSSAIRNTLIHCWGSQYVPSEGDQLSVLPFRELRRQKKPRIVALVSSTPGFSATILAKSLVAVLNGEERQAVFLDADLDKAVLSGDLSTTTDGACEWMILTLPSEASTSNLDRAIRADEAVLVVSPSHWQKGSFYIESLFDRFVDLQKNRKAALGDEITGHRVLELSVVCTSTSNIRQGFTVFKRIETRIHHELDMREPGFDIRLHYLGGILRDRRNIQRAEKLGRPLTTLKPHSPASRCITHMACSLQKPIHEREPRIHVHRPLLSRLFSY